jgi:glucose-6-phosphate 1-dehydrogenase
VSPRVDDLRDAKEDVFKAMRKLKADDLVRGQYEGYRSELGVDRASDVETFVALRVHIDSWRWAGVPFYIRSGKEMPTTVTEVRVELHRPPARVFGDVEPVPYDANYARFQLDPRIVIALGARVKAPGDGFFGEDVELHMYNDHAESQSAYERLLDDAMHGEQTLFARRDGVEESWRVLDDVLVDHPPVILYPKGSWGPPEQDALIADEHGWHDPAPEGEPADVPGRRRAVA